MSFGSTFHCALSVHDIRQITAHHAIVPLHVIYTRTSPLRWVHLSRPGHHVTSLYSYLGVFGWFLFTFPSRLFGPRCGSLDGCAALSLCYSQHSAYPIDMPISSARLPTAKVGSTGARALVLVPSRLEVPYGAAFSI